MAFILIVGIMVAKSFSQGRSSWNDLSFSTHQGSLKFFDHSTGMLYSYSEHNGEVASIWKVEKLGESL